MKRLSFAIGNKMIGEGYPCLIQTMGDRKTTCVDYLVEETNRLAKMGLDMMRFSVLDEEDLLAAKEIKKRVSIPVILDIHFNSSFALKALDEGIDKIRINPGNIGSEAKLREVIYKAKEKDIPIRIGVNSGSLNKYREKCTDKIEAIFLAMDETLSVFEEEGFSKIVLSLKSSDPKELREIYERAYQKYPYPLHIGLTESGFSTLGCIKSTVGLFPILKEGIGDTLRVSLSDERVEEIRACKTLLSLAGRRDNVPDLIVCPGCGRTLIDLRSVSREVENHLDTVNKKITVAVMGCPVNGIGEAKNADYGIAGSGKEGVYLLFSKGKEIGYYPKKEAMERLFDLIDCF